MRIVCGIDVGSRMTKAVLLGHDRRALAQHTIPTGADLPRAAARAYEEVLRIAHRGPDDVTYVASTGFGRYQVPFRSIQITEMTCHARAAWASAPDVGVALDIGAQGARAMRLGPGGRVVAFRQSDKCASGTGRFLERVAHALDVELADSGGRSLLATDPQPISSICAVLAESEVINQVTEGHPVEDILRGVFNAVADRVVALVRQLNVPGPVALTGGVAANVGMVQALTERLGRPLVRLDDAPLMGALGAAILGFDRLGRKTAGHPPGPSGSTAITMADLARTASG